MAKSIKSGAKRKVAAPKSRLSAKAMKHIKGGDTKGKTTTTTSTPKKTFEITDLSFPVNSVSSV